MFYLFVVGKSMKLNFTVHLGAFVFIFSSGASHCQKVAQQFIARSTIVWTA
jgi:hypothetical protein